MRRNLTERSRKMQSNVYSCGIPAIKISVQSSAAVMWFRQERLVKFANDAKKHLANYKASVLGISENGIWSNNKREYEHILPIVRRKENLLLPYQGAMWEFIDANAIRLQSDFHHLNSSQAMAFNLFFPALVECSASRSRLAHILSSSGSPIKEWRFEAVLDSQEGTNVDLYITLESGCKIFIEAKYTETDFGKDKANEARTKKLKEIYAPRLRGMVKPEYLEEEAFFKNYQLLRNISLCSSTQDRVLLVMPNANKVAKRHANTFLTKALLPETQCVSITTIEDIVDSLTIGSTEQTVAYRDHYAQFRQKYFWSSV